MAAWLLQLPGIGVHRDQLMHLHLSRKFLLAALWLLSTGGALAAPVPLALSITGRVALDDVNSAAALGGAAQAGTLRHLSAGAPTTSSFTGDPAGLLPSSLSGALTATGDGIGVRFAMAGTSAGDENSIGLFADYTLFLSNSSAVETFTVVFRALISNLVAASGADAFAFADISVIDASLTEVLFSDHGVDTLNPGNNFNLDSASDIFSVVLTPGASTTFTALQKQRGGVYATGHFSASLDAFLSIDSISSSGGGGNPVPLPGSMALVVLALGGLALARRRTAAG